MLFVWWLAERECWELTTKPKLKLKATSHLAWWTLGPVDQGSGCANLSARFPLTVLWLIGSVARISAHSRHTRLQRRTRHPQLGSRRPSISLPTCHSVGQQLNINNYYATLRAEMNHITILINQFYCIEITRYFWKLNSKLILNAIL